MIDAKMVKDLRDKTQAGIMDCKKALEASNGNMEEAIKWLREKGIAKAEKKSSRVAAEGLCIGLIDGDKAITLELNSETDFVAKNQKFIDLLNFLAKTLVKSNVKDTNEALEYKVDGKTIKDYILEESAIIGEKISLRRVKITTKDSKDVFGLYHHQQGRIVALTVLSGNDSNTLDVAKDIAMQIAAVNPLYISKSDVPANIVARETEIITNTALNENKEAAKPKPENIIVNNIVPGRLEKVLKEMCLLSQPFVKNPDQTVESYLKNLKVKDFVRLEVGEGIEKEVVDFAAEVAAQAGLR